MKNNKKVTVLITSIGTTTAQSIVKGLRQQTDLDITIIGCDINKKNETAGSSFCDIFYTVPYASESDAFLKSLFTICDKHQPLVLFPVHDTELETIAYHKSQFTKKNVYVWVSDYDTVKLCNNKIATFNFFIKNNIKTPNSWDLDTLKKSDQDLVFPLIIKPVNGVASKDVYEARNIDELHVFLKKLTAPVIQEKINGTEYTIDVLCDENNTILACVPRERVETKAGVSTKGKTVHDKMLIDAAKNIATLLNIKGVCNIQCIVNQNGIFFIEVNPRFSGTTALTIAAGVNSPEILTKLATGQPLDKTYFDFVPNVYMSRYWQEVFFMPHAREQTTTRSAQLRGKSRPTL